jgi:tetrahydromethanopterin S-methyltransferase subunit F
MIAALILGLAIGFPVAAVLLLASFARFHRRNKHLHKP